MPTTTIERTCPACNGTGGEGGKKTVNLSDFVSGGGLCSICKGKGKVFDTVHVKERATQSSYSSSNTPSNSRSTSSSSDDDGMASLIIVVVVLVILYYILIITGYIIVYALILTPILIAAWMLRNGWRSSQTWLKLTWPLAFFVIPWVLLNWGIGAILNDLDRAYFSLGTFQQYSLRTFSDVYFVLGVIAVGVIVWDVIVPFMRERVWISSGKIRFKNNEKLTTSKVVDQHKRDISIAKYVDKFKRMTPSQKQNLTLLINLWDEIYVSTTDEEVEVHDNSKLSDEELAKRWRHLLLCFETNSTPDETLGDFLKRCIENKKVV